MPPKQSSRRPSPAQLLKKARILAERCPPSRDTDLQASQLLQECLMGLASRGVTCTIPQVEHSLDLEKEEEGYILATTLVLLSTLCRRAGDLSSAEQYCCQALVVFPDHIAGRLALAKVLLLTASSKQDIMKVESLLEAAVATMKELGEREGGLLADNPACAEEIETGVAAQSLLALLQCQAGRDEAAKENLLALGYHYRLAKGVLHYPLPPSEHQESPSVAGQLDTPDELSGRPLAQTGVGQQCTPTCANGTTFTTAICQDSSPCPRRYVQAFDQVLPVSLLHHLQEGFGPGSSFWGEHDYGRVGYFSYMHPLDAPVISSIHQAALHLHKLVSSQFPHVSSARYVEWWAHCRPHCHGHQLHFDSDDEGQGGVRNPLVSSVIYLSGSCGGPTLVTDQPLGGQLGAHAWMVMPRTNRVTFFDGRYLHGVLPGRGSTPGGHTDARRVTLMIAFWEEMECRSCPDFTPGPSRPFPQPSPHSPYKWPLYFIRLPPEHTSGMEEGHPLPAEVTHVSPVWEPLDEKSILKFVPTYEKCFQGF